MIKTYGINRTAEAVFKLTLGKTTVSCTFKNGVPEGKDKKPATLTTDNGVVQVVIEQSDLYKQHTIFLVNSNEEPVAEEERPKPAEEGQSAVNDSPGENQSDNADNSEKEVHADVTDLASAITVLASKGVKPKKTWTPEAVLAEAVKLNLEFPNFNA